MEIDITETRINNLTIKSSDGVEYNTGDWGLF
jgi:hypothetical protein